MLTNGWNAIKIKPILRASVPNYWKGNPFLDKFISNKDLPFKCTYATISRAILFL